MYEEILKYILIVVSVLFSFCMICLMRKEGNPLSFKLDNSQEEIEKAQHIKLTLEKIKVDGHVRIFVSKSDADINTPLTDPNYVTSLSLYPRNYVNSFVTSLDKVRDKIVFPIEVTLVGVSDKGKQAEISVKKVSISTY